MKATAKRWVKRLLGLAFLAFVGVNVLAWFHAGAMVHWQESGERTGRPEELGLLQRMGVLITGVSIPRPVNARTPADSGLAFETHRFASGSGAELEAWFIPVEGARVTSILFHGHAGTKDSMLGIAKGLTAFASNVLMVDFYGSGGSSGTGTTLGIDEADDVAAAVAYVRERWPGQLVLLYGQSMGGAAVLRAVAKLGTTPDAIVLDCTFGRLLATVASRFHRMGLPATPLAQMLVLWGSVRIGRNGFAHEPVEYARAVRCPTLVLQGVNDPNITPEDAREMAGNLGGWKRCSEYMKAGHSDLRSSQPEQWKEDIGLLIAELRREP